jgi:hypothetical protein
MKPVHFLAALADPRRPVDQSAELIAFAGVKTGGRVYNYHDLHDSFMGPADVWHESCFFPREDKGFWFSMSQWAARSARSGRRRPYAASSCRWTVIHTL